MQLVNISLRDFYRFSEYLHLRKETTGKQLRWILAQVREMLIAHPKVLSEYLHRVKLDSYNEYAQIIRVDTFINGELEWEDYLDVRQDLLFRISDIIHNAGTDFAYPSQTVYRTRDKKDIAPSDTVDRGMECSDSEYPYPNASEARYEELVDRMKYPPTNEEDFSRLPLEDKIEKDTEEKEKLEKNDEEEKDIKVMRR